MIQLTVVTTLFGAVSAAAAIDEGLLGDADSRVLVIANNAPIPEVASELTDAPGVEAVLARFDRVVDLGALLHPQQPSRWKVAGIDLPTQERLLREYWSLGDEPIQLVVESIHVPPAATIVQVFYGCPVIVLSEGLMSYGPTRNAQAHSLGERLDALVYLDLVEGLEPILLTEHGVSRRPVPPAAFRAVIQQMATAAGIQTEPSETPTVLVVGQYLAALKLISPAQESALQLEMLTSAREIGAERVLFKPHPSASSTNTATLIEAMADLGLEIEVVDPTLSAEVVMATSELIGVVAGFSTALATAQRVFGLDTKSVGTDAVLQSLHPYQNSNRIPITIIDYLDRQGRTEVAISELGRLATAVAYAMQPETLAHLRGDAEAFLRENPHGARKRYFRQGRLNVLRLPGALAPSRVRRIGKAVLDRMPSRLYGPLWGAIRSLRSSSKDKR